VTAVNPIKNVLSAPLGPNWTVDGVAEQLLDAIAAQPSEDAPGFILDADDSSLDLQSRRLLRPLLACLATMSAAETGTQPSLYGGPLAFRRSGSVWVLGEFENRAEGQQLVLRRSIAPPDGMDYRASTGLSNSPPIVNELLDCLSDDR